MMLFAACFGSSLLGSTLHLAYSSKPGRLNPLLATDSASGEIAGWMFNALVTYDANGSIIPELAESYRFETPTKLVFTLRRNVRWSDGKPFGAQDVVATYNAAVSPKVFTPYSEPFRFVKSLRALDAARIEVVYTRPYYNALDMWTLSILPAHLIADDPDLMTSSFNRQPVGTGPYTLTQFAVSRDIVLTKNRDYFIHEPRIDRIVYHFAPDPTSEFLMLRQGALDLGGLSPLQLERQVDAAFRARYRIVEQPGHGYTYLGFNLRLPKFRDPRVRKALSLAIDRQQIVDVLLFGHGNVCTGPFLPGTFAFDPSVRPPARNVAQARALLAAAGYGPGRPLTFELSTSAANSTRMLAAQMIQQQLAGAGVVMTIRTMEWQAFLNTVVGPRRFDAVLLGWSMGLLPDAYAIWHSDADKKGGFNLVGYRNATLDRLIDEAEGTVDKRRLGVLYRQMFRQIAADNPYLFLYIPRSITAVSKKIRGVRPALIGLTYNVIDWDKGEE